MPRRRIRTHAVCVLLLAAAAGSVAGSSPSAAARGSMPELAKRTPISAAAVSSPAPQLQRPEDGPNATRANVLVGAGTAMQMATDLSPPEYQQHQVAGLSNAMPRTKGGRGGLNVMECKQDGCDLSAKFGNPVPGVPVKCHAHKAAGHGLLGKKNKAGRGRPGVRMCDQDQCQLVAKFGDPAGGGPVKCRTHKMPHHRLLRGWTPCLHAEGCKQKSSFGFPSGRPTYCQAHKSPAHVSLSFRGRKCLFSGCPKQPSFGNVKDWRIRFCQQHKAKGDVDLRSLRCRHPEGCLKGATFASPGCKVPSTCAAHRLPEDVRVNGVKNQTSLALAEISVCPQCLQKISRRNMAKHRMGAQCRARGASPYIKHKRNRMGRDVSEALKGRNSRRHPTLSQTPALHPESFMEHAQDQVSCQYQFVSVFVCLSVFIHIHISLIKSSVENA
jgi:hypothetical protein